MRTILYQNPYTSTQHVLCNKHSENQWLQVQDARDQGPCEVCHPNGIPDPVEFLKDAIKAKYRTKLHTAADTVLKLMHDTALGPHRAALFGLASKLYVEGEQ